MYIVSVISDLPVDCTDLFERKVNKSGIYTIKPKQSEPFNVYCEMSSGGWFFLIDSHQVLFQNLLFIVNSKGEMSMLPWKISAMHSIDGGSTVIQRRVDVSVDFDQTWEKYEKGFGDLESKYCFAFFWLFPLSYTNEIVRMATVRTKFWCVCFALRLNKQK